MSAISRDGRAIVDAVDRVKKEIRGLADSMAKLADAVSTPVVGELKTVGTCDASTLGVSDRHLGPCVLRDGHDGPVHRGPEGETWATLIAAADDTPTTTADDGPRCVCGDPIEQTGDPSRWVHRAVPGRPALDAHTVRPPDGVPDVPWARGIRDHPSPEQAPAADEDQALRWARRESLLVLVTRVQHGRTLTAEEARTLRHHVETEMREAETARTRAEQADAVTAWTKRLLERRTTTLRERAERAEAAIERVRAAHRRTTVQTTGGPRDVCESCELDSMSHPWPCPTAETLDGTEQPTTTEQPSTCTATIPDTLGSAALHRCVAPAGHYDETEEPVYTGDDWSPGGWHTDGEGHVWSDRAAAATPHTEQPTTEAP